ncbi:MAG TPA: S8 family serine peptidase, partial [Phycisphaerae bacterium]|nr:S8 family serine peptidase [Phycisphaerae bacterium]
WHLPKIQAPTGWDVTTGSSSVIIAFVDSGVDTNHPDLAGRIWNNPSPGTDPEGMYFEDFHGWSFVDGNNNVQPVPGGGDNDTVSHGTLTAGLAAAIGNEGYGTAGVSWQPKIMECKVFDAGGNGASNSMIVEAMDYAVARGAKVINLSLGTQGTFESIYTPAVRAAYEAGVVVVAAAGNNTTAFNNNSTSWSSPVCNDSDATHPGANWVLGVAATDQFDRKSDFSNWDSSTAKTFVDVAAPGTVVYGTVFQDGSPQFSAFWGTNSGTSFSAPIVAGLAALVLSQHPTYTPAQVIATIRGNADNIDSVSGYPGMLGGGRVNMARALDVVSPPQAVTNVQAADTLGDSGGSITVTWLKSGDDGAGANSVTGYTLLRREGVGGAFASAGSVAAGVQQYLDTTTTDGVPYYYKVRTFAGALFSDSSIVGPAQSRDDSPPAKITTLAAVDRPADSGGAINLTWTYTPPADFAAYRLYRDAYAFTTVAGRTPIQTITDSGATGYTDATVTDGADYYYALTAVDQSGNENPSVTAVGPAQSYPNQPVVFPAGVQLLGTPVVPADGDPATLFGLPQAGLHYARYNTVGAAYLYYTTPVPADRKLALGAGFWLELPGETTITPAGASAPAGDLPVSVLPGWDLFGNPFFGAFDFSTCTVRYNGSTMDLYSAQTAGLLNSVAWVYQDGGYAMVNGGTAGATVAPWQGFWVRGLQACTLILARPVGGTGAAGVRPLTVRPASPTKPVVAWQVRLTAQAG